MKTVVTMITVLAMLTLALAPVGCICKYPNVAPQIQGSLSTVQGFYDTLVAKFLDDKTDATVRAAIVSADLALSLAGALQKQWCPDPALAAKAEAMAKDAAVRAALAGVK